MEVPTIAVVGMGGFARQHLRYVAQVEERGLGRQVAQVAIPADQEAFSQELDAMRERGIEVYASLRQMLAAARERIAIVCIPTGIPLHCQMTVAAHQAGCHVLVEKPAAGSVQDVDAMLSAADRAGRLCAVGFQHVYQREYRQVKDWVCQGRLGAVRRVKSFGCWPRDPGYYRRNGWAGRLAVGDTWVLDGPHNNALAHAVNAMLFMGSDVPQRALTPACVRAELYRANAIESADTAALRVHTTEGPEVFFAVSHCTEQNVNPVYIVEGDKGRVQLAYEGDITATWEDGTVESATADRQPPGVLDDVVEVVAGRRQALMCPLDIARNQTLCSCGAFESSAIHELPQALRRVEGDGGRIAVHGVGEAVQRAWQEAALFSELGLDWAVPGTEIDMVGYTYFPTYRGNVGG
jgi:predicted dehydrogenase